MAKCRTVLAAGNIAETQARIASETQARAAVAAAPQTGASGASGSGGGGGAEVGRVAAGQPAGSSGGAAGASGASGLITDEDQQKWDGLTREPSVTPLATLVFARNPQ